MSDPDGAPEFGSPGHTGSREECDVTLVWSDGRVEHVTVGPSLSIVDAAEADGISLPYGCRFGVCGTCTAELLAGEVDHAREPRGLRSGPGEGTFVLPCIARPTSDCRLRVGHEIQAEAVGTPWK